MIDFRSDTVTRPTPAMRQAMQGAELGDDVFGDDPTVNRLQAFAAEALGFEAALFAPSGTQTNLIALMCQCERGDEAIVGQMWHTYRWEGGGMAVLGSIQPQPIENQPDGTLRIDDIAAAIKPDDPHFARTRLIGLENTTGGKVLPLRYLEEVGALARSRGLLMHLDGARLFNAAAAISGSLGDSLKASTNFDSSAGEGRPAAGKGTDTVRRPRQSEILAAARRICAPFDTVSVCLSKGLGAPVGSLVLGSTQTIARGRRIRKMLGGGMRQAGVIAAAGLHALEHHLERLTDDHDNARMLFEGLTRASQETRALQGKLRIASPDTNILFVDVDPVIGDSFQAYLKREGVAVTGGAYHGGLRQRWVTHLDVDRDAVQRSLAIVNRFTG